MTVLAALALVVLAEVVAMATATVEPTPLERLNAAPGEDVFVFGNSMFQTGINFGPLAEKSGRDVVFDYHNGHYTSLWYLIADQALPLADPPPLVTVWGFRPSYAADPAFRSNRENDNDLFDSGDDTYRRLTIGSDEPAAVWELSGQLREAVAQTRGLWARREQAQSALSARATDAGVHIVGILRPTDTAPFRERLASGEVTVVDEILRVTTDGEIQLAEERVVDGQGDFVQGDTVPFADSFVPLIAEKIAEIDTTQLVVIWKPVSAVNGGNTAADEAFVADAIRYFEANDIQYVDLYHSPELTLEMFASGDHYNELGREVVTDIIADRLEDLGTS